MTDHFTSREQELDEKLADFTDQVMNGNIPTIEENDSELAELKKAVLKLQSAAQAARPNVAAARRMRLGVMEKCGSKPKSPSWLFPLFQSWQRIALAGTVLVSALVVSITLFSSPTSDQMTATAEMNPLIAVIAAVAGIIIILLLLKK
jgi:hypothetical protein